MEIFYYPKGTSHNKSDTDKMIKESLGIYTSEHSLSMYNGKILRTSLGKPYIDYPLFIGVSHTDEVAVIAIGKENFGIDCEEIGRIVERQDEIAKRFFTENERNLIKSDVDFLEMWVKKEAYVKFTGQGITAMSSIDVTALSGFKKIENNKNLIIYIYKE